MSIDGGGAELADALVEETKRMLEEAAAEEEQLSLLDPISSEEMELAQARLGPDAGFLATVLEARQVRKATGRRPGSRNKRTDDFARYILAHGQDPAITLMQIQTTQPELLVARSIAIDPMKRRMSYAEAQSLRVRCAEALMPFVHSKKPIGIDATIRGVIVQETIGDMSARVNPDIIDGEIVGIIRPEGDLHVDREGEFRRD